MKLSPALLCSAVLATAAMAQNHAPVAQLPNLTASPAAVPFTLPMQLFVTDPDLQYIEGTQVTINTTLGSFNMELFDSLAPISVANFLSYFNSGKYTNTMWQRSVPGFVIQTGGYTYPPDTQVGVNPTPVVAAPPIKNEARISNVRGTVAMALTAGNPDSATSQWFVNLADNGGPPRSLDTHTITSTDTSGNVTITTVEGYTVFGRIIEGGMTVPDAIAAVPVYDFNGFPHFDPPQGVFNTLPLQNFKSIPVKGSNVIYMNSGSSGPKMTFTAVSDNPTIANPVVNGTRLIVTPGNTGTATLTVTATDFNGLSSTSVSTVTVEANAPVGSLTNISTRAFVKAVETVKVNGVNTNTDQAVMIGGFIIQGTGTKQLLIRALGTDLTQYGVPNVLQDPTLELRDSNGQLIASNNTWNVQTNPADVAAIQATGYAPGDIREPALLQNLPPGEYTVIVSGLPTSAGAALTTAVGNALLEIYDLDTVPTAHFANLSTRGEVGTGDNVMIGGITVTGTTPKRMLIRAVGPSLAAYGILTPLLDPRLEIYSGGRLIALNDNWQLATDGTANPDKAAIVASGYAPTSDQESALILSLPAGQYTAIVRGANNTTGVALIEAFDLD